MAVLCRQTLPIHLAGGGSQLVGFVNDKRPVVVQQRLTFLQPVGSIGQKVIVVAYLDKYFRISDFLPILAITAGISS